MLPHDYLERGLPLFESPEVGIVYSDIEIFGDRSRRQAMPEWDLVEFDRENFMHAGSLVRRMAPRSATPSASRTCSRHTRTGWSGGGLSRRDGSARNNQRSTAIGGMLPRARAGRKGCRGIITRTARCG